MSQKEMKQKRIQYLLLRMQKEPMNIHQMADAVNLSQKTFSKYLTEMRFKKLVYIAHYNRSATGAYTVFYQTGNFPDAEKPLPFGQQEYNRRYKAKMYPNSIKKPATNNARPDFAAHWLFNPIQEI
jgi:predicted transcriptional regulator